MPSLLLPVMTKLFSLMLLRINQSIILMKVLLGLSLQMRLIFSLHAESKVNKDLKEKKATKVIRASKASKDRKVSKVPRVSKVSKEPRAIKVTKETRVTHSLGMKFQQLRAKNSKAKKATKVALVILVFIMVQLSQKLIKRSLFGLIHQ
nr:MAG TPA: hypothetical protein [Caudoviricetes sp.]